MRCLLVLLAASCGRIGFDLDGGSSGGDGGIPCVGVAELDWSSGLMPNDPGSGLPNGASRVVDQMMVIDTVAGLVWQRAPAADLLTWDVARMYCAKLSLAGCNHWRLPQRIELATIVDHTYVHPVIDSIAFPNTADDVYWWSATPQLGSTNNSWIQNFYNGNSFWQANTIKSHVRCVHSQIAALAPPARYQITGAAVYDVDTTLTWQRTVVAGTSSFADAASYCAMLPGGWRLPSVGELETIVDSSAPMPTLDATAFPSTPVDAKFWSSTPLAGGNNEYMVVGFDSGNVVNMLGSALLHVRCVH